MCKDEISWVSDRMTAEIAYTEKYTSGLETRRDVRDAIIDQEKRDLRKHLAHMLV